MVGQRSAFGLVASLYIFGQAEASLPGWRNLWSRGRTPLGARRKDKRGEAPKGVPPVGRSKALKGEPQERCGGRRPVARREEEQAVERVPNPEGGRCRGVKPPGGPDSLRWQVL